MKKHYKKYKEKIKEHFQTIIQTKTSPHSLALGFAIGTFINIIPTPGFNIILGLLSLLIFKKASKLSLLISMAIWNPFITPLIYLSSFKIGDLLFTSSNIVVYDLTLMETIYSFSRRFLVGNLILACFTSLLSYILVKYSFSWYYKRKHTTKSIKD
ncbi:MAG: DUF2062 domain-containing protein [Candidatus Woesearchaeota archaeon]